MSFEEDNKEMIEYVRRSSGNLIGDLISDRNWKDSSKELGAENKIEIERFLSSLPHGRVPGYKFAKTIFAKRQNSDGGTCASTKLFIG